MNQITYVDPKKLKINPYRKALGIQPIDGFEKTILEKSIRENGIIDPIKANEDLMILDGHDRTAIVISFGMKTIPVRIKKGLTEDEQKIFFIEENLNRKHLLLQTRIMMAADYYIFRKENAPVGTSITEESVAENFGVSPHSLGRGKFIVESEKIPDSLKNGVRAGKLGVFAVADLDREDPETIKAVTEIVEEQLKEGKRPIIPQIITDVKNKKGDKTIREHEESKSQDIKDQEPTAVEMWLRDNLFDPCKTIRHANTTAWFNKLDMVQSDFLMADLEATIQVMKNYQTQLKHIPITRSGYMEAVSGLSPIPIDIKGEIVKKEE